MPFEFPWEHPHQALVFDRATGKSNPAVIGGHPPSGVMARPLVGAMWGAYETLAPVAENLEVGEGAPDPGAVRRRAVRDLVEPAVWGAYGRGGYRWTNARQQGVEIGESLIPVAVGLWSAE